MLNSNYNYESKNWSDDELFYKYMNVYILNSSPSHSFFHSILLLLFLNTKKKQPKLLLFMKMLETCKNAINLNDTLHTNTYTYMLNGLSFFFYHEMIDERLL